MNDNDTQREIGSLTEFKDWAKGEFREVNRKLDSVIAFKWRVIGSSGLFSFLVVIAVEYFSNRRG